jgi:hypothetical protein
VVFATFNFADSYSPLLCQMVRGGSVASGEPIGYDIVCRLTDDAPNMPSLQQMHRLIAQSPRAQAKFFLLMDDIADIYFMDMHFCSLQDMDSFFMGMDIDLFHGRHHVNQSSQHQQRDQHQQREDQLVSTATSSHRGYGVAELEAFESQERGFQHVHRISGLCDNFHRWQVRSLTSEREAHLVNRCNESICHYEPHESQGQAFESA